MLAALILAAATAAPLGVWPEATGPALTTVDDVDFYLAEPEDDYSILAIQPIAPPLAKADAASLKRLAGTAQRLGADAVVLLGELPEAKIPEDTDQPLPITGRYAMAVFVSFDSGDASPSQQKAGYHPRRRAHQHPGRGRTALLPAVVELRRPRR